MKKLILLTGVVATVLFIGTISASVFADTIFTGMSSSGIIRLSESLGIGAYNNPGNSMAHLVLSEDSSRLYCAGSRRITVLDSTTLGEIKTIGTPGEIRAIELANGALYVLIAGNPAKVLVISDASQELTAEIEVGMNPLDIVVTSDGSKLFVAKGGESKIDVISAERGEIVNSIDCGGNPCSLVLSNDESKLYAADSASSEVIVMDAQANNVLKRIAAGEECVRLCPAGGDIYAIDNSSTAKAVYIIDTSSNTLTDTIQLEEVPYTAAVHPNGDYSIIVSRVGNKIYKVEGLEVVAERIMPNAQSVLVTDSVLGIPRIIYSGGSEVVSNQTDSSDSPMSDGSASAGDVRAAGTMLDLIYPNGFETLGGNIAIWWFSDIGGTAYLSISTDGGITYDPINPAGIADIIGVFIWEKTSATYQNLITQDYDSSCKIAIDVDAYVDTSNDFFTIDNTPPEVEITYPLEQDQQTSTSTFVRATASDALAGVADHNLQMDGEQILIKVDDGSGPPDRYYATKATAEPFTGQYVRSVPITGGGVRNIITASAQDTAVNPNIGTDEVSVFEGWVTHIEFPHSVDYIISSVVKSSGAAVCQMTLDLMRQTGGIPLLEPLPDQDAIFSESVSHNTNITITDELDEGGIEYALTYYDPWSPEGYNFDGRAVDVDFDEYIDDLAHWIAWDVPAGIGGSMYERFMPALVPKYGLTLKPYHWVVLNGVAADTNPYETTGYTVYGMWITDPEEEIQNIGRDQYHPAFTLSTYLEPAPNNFVSVMDPPKDAYSEVSIAPPQVNESTLALVEIAEYFNSADQFEKHLVDSALIVDLEEAQPIVHYSLDGDLLNLFSPEGLEDSPSICWKDIINPMLLTDKKFRAAIDGAIARDFLFVTRLDTDEKYILIPFDKFAQGKFLSYAAIMVDRELGYFKQASWVEEPTRYVQVPKEDAIVRVIDLYPEAASKNIETRLVWKPGDISSSEFYPYWEITTGENKYYVVGK